MTTIRNFFGNENGATSVEYAMIASGIGGAIVVAVGLLGGNVKTMWTAVSTAMK